MDGFDNPLTGSPISNPLAGWKPNMDMMAMALQMMANNTPRVGQPINTFEGVPQMMMMMAKKNEATDEKKRDREALEALLIKEGVEPNEAKRQAYNPASAKLYYDQMRAQKQMKADASAMSGAFGAPVLPNSSGAYLDTLIKAESGGNPNARNPNSSATGLAQFTDGTWNEMVRSRPDLGLTPDGRTDPEQARRAAVAFTEQNKGVLQQNGIAPTPQNLYAAHFFGAGGATQFLKGMEANPNVPAASLASPEAVKANRSVFFDAGGQPKTAGQVYQSLTGRFAGLDTGGPDAQGGARAGEAAMPDSSGRSGLPPPEKILEQLRRPDISDKTRSQLMEMYKLSTEGQRSDADMRAYEFDVKQGFKGSRFDWDMQRRNAGASKVNVGDGSDKFKGKFAEKQADRWDGYLREGDSAKQRMSDIGMLRETSRRLGSQGSSADLKRTIGPYAEALGVEIEGLSDIQTFESITKRLAPQLRVEGSGSTSDVEYKGFLSAIGPLSNNPQAREVILDTFEATERLKAARADIATRLADEQITRGQAEKEVRALPDPMESFREFKRKNPVEWNKAKTEARQAEQEERKVIGGPMTQARDAIKRGASREAVIQRMKEAGYDTSGL